MSVPLSGRNPGEGNVSFTYPTVIYRVHFSDTTGKVRFFADGPIRHRSRPLLYVLDSVTHLLQLVDPVLLIIVPERLHRVLRVVPFPVRSFHCLP